MKKLAIAEFTILALGVIFAWTNLAIEVIDWLNDRACRFSCTAGEVVNPFLTPCFYGATFFLIAFILSAVILKKTLAAEKK